MSRFPKITNIIRGAIKRMDMTDKEFSNMTGIKYPTLQDRWRDPGSWRMYEWGSVLRNVTFMDEELKELNKEIRKG